MSEKPITIEVFDNHLDPLDKMLIYQIVERRNKEKLNAKSKKL